MSNYTRAAYHPPTNTVRAAYWMDDYFGKHQYGVQFQNTDDDTVYHPREVDIPVGKVFVERKDNRIEEWEARLDDDGNPYAVGVKNNES